MLLLLLGTGGWRGGSSRNGLPTRKKNPSHEKLLGKDVLAFSLLQEDDYYYLPGTPGLLTPSGATTAETAALLHPLAFQATRLESTLQPPCFLRGETPLCDYSRKKNEGGGTAKPLQPY